MFDGCQVTRMRLSPVCNPIVLFVSYLLFAHSSWQSQSRTLLMYRLACEIRWLAVECRQFLVSKYLLKFLLVRL